MQEERNIFETDISTGGIPKFKFDDFLLPLRLHQVEVRALLTQIEMLCLVENFLRRRLKIFTFTVTEF